jgi:hypothetical protein
MLQAERLGGASNYIVSLYCVNCGIVSKGQRMQHASFVAALRLIEM